MAPLIAPEVEPVRTGGARRVAVALLVALALVLGPIVGPALRTIDRWTSGAAPSDGAAAIAAVANRTDVKILAGTPSTLDPAAQGDVGSGAYGAQLFESLTAFDGSLTLRPALARSWEVSADGRTVTFHLRPGLTFSDGTALAGADVVRSWLRIIDPAHPSPLASLMSGVAGAAAYLAGTDRDPGHVGLRADGLDVIVTVVSAGADFPAVVASPTFGIVPPRIDDARTLQPGTFVGSGGYVLQGVSASEITLAANPRYWAGKPSVTTIHMVTDIGGRSPVTAFEAGDLDYAQISAYDAGWIRYDGSLGPQLRLVPSLSLQYVGFRADRGPFADVRVRQAFAAAVDWKRIVQLGGSDVGVPATSMVPPRIPDAPAADWLPAHDPAHARQLLADAGYPGGRGFPAVVLGTSGFPYAAAIAADLSRELGVTLNVELWSDYFDRLGADPPDIWTMGWVADYPRPNDFLGILLRTGSTNNYGRWSSPAFDAAVDAALAASPGAATSSAWAKVLGIVQSDAPVIPISNGDGWALSRTGLLGAGQNGLGFLRGAGLAWGAP